MGDRDADGDSQKQSRGGLRYDSEDEKTKSDRTGMLT
jgi:hypothetical protein